MSYHSLYYSHTIAVFCVIYIIKTPTHFYVKVSCRSSLRHILQNYYKSNPHRLVIGGTKALVRISRMNTRIYVVRVVRTKYPTSTERIVILLGVVLFKA
jgi:hypothetical protein